MALLEIACFDPESAVVASDAGAHRIELCDDQASGGVSPPLQWLRDVKARVSIPVFVMIRPRGGDFHYSSTEFDRMQADLARFKENGADGFVLGILTQDREVDVSRTAELVRQAHPLPCTFHRAIDDTPSLMQALEHVALTGCRAILTSGGASSAVHGIHALRSLVERAHGRIDIIPGGGVRSNNLVRIQTATGATVFHSAAILPGTSQPNSAEIHQMKAQLEQPDPTPGGTPRLSRAMSCSSPESAEDDMISFSAVSIGDQGDPT